MNNNHTMRATHSVQKTTTLRIAPIPSAEELARYEAIHPGFADRIISMAEKQSKHRRIMGVLAVIKGHSFFGAGVSFSAIGAIVWCFIKGRKTG